MLTLFFSGLGWCFGGSGLQAQALASAGTGMLSVLLKGKQKEELCLLLSKENSDE